jgi:hypothetical protein
MDRQNAGTGALLLALLGTLIFTTVKPNPESTNASTSSRAALTQASVKHDFPQHTGIDIIMDFLDADPDQTVLKLPWSATEPWPARDWPEGDQRKGFTISYVIATLPDPSKASLSALFDARIEAIQRAAGQEDYVLDSVDFPWSYPESGSASGSKLAEEVDFKSEQETDWSTGLKSKEATPPGYIAITPRAPSQYPGLLLFRWNGKGRDAEQPPPKLLLVYLVGETLTTGINKTQMRMALDEVAWLSGWTQKGPPPAYLPASDDAKLKILGPSFSGSVDSLKFAIQSWLDSRDFVPPVPNIRDPFWDLVNPLFELKDVTIRIVSGTTTAVSGIDFQGLDVPWPFIRASFSSTMAPLSTDVMTSALETVFSKADGHKALLAEMGTVYGAKFQSESQPGDRYIVVRFPLHIATLRTATGNSAEPDISRSLRFTPANIPFPHGESEAGNIAKPYSARTAIYDDLSLSWTLEELKREKVKYIGIVATDIADRIYLVRRIRETMPDAQIVLTSNDLLYLHSDFLPDTYGSLILSTYPLLGTNQLWTYPFQGGTTPDYFENDGEEGVFNAALALLGDFRDMDDYSPPLQKTPGPPGVWISIVGKNGIWPLRYVPRETAEKSMVDADALDASNQRKGLVGQGIRNVDLAAIFTPFRFSLTFYILMILSGVFGLLLIASRSSGRRGAKWVPDWFAARFGRAIFPTFENQVGWNAAGFAVWLGIIVFSFWMIAAIPSLNSSPTNGIFQFSPPWFTTALFGFFVTPVVLTMAIIAALTKAADQQGERERIVRVCLAGVAITVLSLSTGFYRSVLDQDHVDAVLLFLRATSLRSGVSPLAPILYVGIAALVLTLCSLNRLARAQIHRISPPSGQELANLGVRQPARRALFLDLDADSFHGISTIESKIARSINQSFFSIEPQYWVVPALVAIIFAGSLLHTSWTSGSIDGQWFLFLFVTASAAIYFGLTASLVRMYLIWSATKHLLRRLYSHPSRLAYERFRARGILPGIGSAAGPVGFAVWDAEGTWTNIEFGIQVARKVLRPLGNYGSLPSDVGEAERHLRRAKQSDAYGLRERAVRERFCVEGWLGIITRSILTFSEPLWRSEPTQLGVSDEDMRQEAELMLASRVLDLVRHILPHLTNLAMTTAAGMILMLMAISSYAFPSETFLLWFSWATVLSAVGVMLYVFGSVNRDRIMSLLAGTTPGMLTFNANFVFQLLIYGAVPILAVLGVQFPGHMGQAVGWLSKIGGPHGS